MRRGRSCAFHSDTPEDYLQVAKDNQHGENFYYNKPTKNDSNFRSKSYMSQSDASIEEDFFFESPLDRYRSEANVNSDFRFPETNSDDLFESQGIMHNSPSAFMIDLLDDSAVGCEMPDLDSFPVMREYKYNYMMVGDLNVGKHALINSQFPEDNETDSAPLRNRLDLVIRKTETPTAKTTYEFWIKELLDDSYEKLIELYYKKCSLFVFVYDLTTRDSFEKLKKEISKIRDCVGAEKFVGLLIATRSDETEKRAVTYEEGLKLKNEYGLKHFNETNMYIEKETQQLLKKIGSVSLAMNELEIF